MKDLISQYYRLILHSEPQRFAVAVNEGNEVKYPHQSRHLTEADIIKSIEGKLSLGVMLLTDVSPYLTKSGVIDVDIPRDAKDLIEGLALAEKLKDIALECNLRAYIEFSGNRGYHLWIFVNKPVTGELMQKCLRAIALKANFEAKEVFPNNDVKETKCIKLPFTTHLKTNNRSGFIGEDFNPNNPLVTLESQPELMRGFIQNDPSDIISLVNEVGSEDKPVNSEVRSKEDIEAKLNDFGSDHPSCIKHLMSNGAPLGVDYNQANLSLIRYCLTRGLNLEESLKLAESMAKNTPENHSTSKDYQGKIKNFRSAYNSALRNSDNYLFDCKYVLDGVGKGEAHTRGCIGTKCKVHFNYSEDRAVTRSISFINALIFNAMVNLASEGKEVIKSQILRQSENIVQSYLVNEDNPNISDSIRLIESEVIGYLLKNPEALSDYADIFPNGFIVTSNQTISDYIDYCLSLTLPSEETIEEYFELVRVNGVKVTASLRFADYSLKVQSDNEPIETISDLISDSEKLLTLSVSDNNLLPTSEKLEGLILQLLSEDRTAIPTFSEDLNYLLNGGFSRGRFYVISAGPANGKSTICLQCADYASNLGYRVGYFSFEMSLDQIFITQIARLGEINSGYLENKVYFKNDSLKLKMLNTIEQYYEDYSDNIHVIECDDTFTPNKILSVIKKLKLDLVFIDYLQLMNSGDRDLDNNGNETIKISKIATELKRLARKSDTPIIAISDINKTSFDNAKSGKRGLDMTALRDSFKIAHSADCVMLLSSNDLEPKNENDTIKTQLDVVKLLWEKKDLKVAKTIENIDNRTTLNPNTADTFSRLYIDKNRTGKCGDVIFKYSKAIHKFEPLNYLKSVNKEEY